MTDRFTSGSDRMDAEPVGTGSNPEDLHDASFGELFKKLSAETSVLIRQEVALAKAELSQKCKDVGKGAGLFGGAGLVGLLAAGALTAAIILVLATFLPDWVAALIVAVVFGAIAAVLALRGKSEIQKATPPVPEQTIETTKEDVAWAKTRARSGTR